MVSYKKQMSSLIIGQMLSLVLGMLVPLILVRELTLEDYGNYAKINILIGPLATIFTFSVSSELFYFYPRETNLVKQSIYIFQSYLILILLASLCIIVMNIPYLKGIIFSDNFLFDNFFLISLCVFFAIPEKIVYVLYVLNHDNLLSKIYLPLSTVIRVVLILTFYYINESIVSIIYAILLVILLQFLFSIFYTLKVIRQKNKKLIFWNKVLLKLQFKYLLPFGLANSLKLLGDYLDKFIVLMFVTSPVYAIYSIAFYGIPGLPQMYLSISQGFVPRMAEAYSRCQIQEVIDLYKSMCKKTLFYTIPIVLFVIYFADVIVPFVFSVKYIDSVFYFRIYLFSYIIVAFGFGNIIRATGDTKKTLFVSIISFVFLLPFTFLMIKFFSLNGAIISALLNILIPKIMLMYYDSKVLNVSVVKLLPLDFFIKILITSILPLLLIFIIDYFFVDSILSFFVLTFIYFLSVVCFQFYLNVFIISKNELINKIKCVI